MDATSKKEAKRLRDIYYYRQRYKNRVFAKLVAFFAEEAERTGVTKKDIAGRLRKDPALITRWLSSPGNLTLETISDLLLGLDAEAEPGAIVRFSERLKPNYAHPLIAKIIDAKHGTHKPQIDANVGWVESIPPGQTSVTITVSSVANENSHAEFSEREGKSATVLING